VGHQHPVGVPRRAHSLHMRHGRRTGEADTPSGLMGAPTQVHVLVVHEVGLVEAPQLLQRVTPGQEAGTGDPFGLDDAVTGGGTGVVAPGETVLGHEECEQSVARRVQEGGEAADRRVDGTFVRDPGTHHGPGRPLLEDAAQLVEGPGVHPQIGVGDQHPLRRRRGAAEHGQSPVHARAESEVLPGLDHQHVPLATFGQESVDGALRAPQGAVVDDDHGRGPVVEQRADALGEQRPGIVIDDDGANGARHCRLNTPWRNGSARARPAH
jgi:hypothetical protein